MNQPILDQYLTTQGRMSRTSFWLYFVAMFAIFFLYGAALNVIEISEVVQLIIGFALLPFLLIGIIVQIKRLHDLNMSGWFLLLNLIPCLGGLILLILCGFSKGTPGPNKYGPDPTRPEIVDAVIVDD